MVHVITARCSGCGECAAVCPSDAIYLKDGLAVIDSERCNLCLACLKVCPVSAMEEVETTPVVIPDRVVHIPGVAAPQSQRTQLLPVIGAVLMWTGREIIPRLTHLLLNVLEDRIQHRQYRETSTRGGRRSQGRRSRHRQRQFRRNRTRRNLNQYERRSK